jgi:hypothetical protein
MGELQGKVNAYAEQQEAQGKTVDRASLFVGESMNYALQKDPQQQNPQLMGMFDAGKEWVDARTALNGGGQQQQGAPAAQEQGPDPAKARELESLQKQAAQQSQGLPGAN